MVNEDVIFLLDVIITGFLCLFGFVGNILCLVALCFERRKNSNIYLLSALAVFDWLMLLFMLNGVVLPGLCKYFDACKGYITFMRAIVRVVWATGCIVQTATIWMVVAVTLDRFIAVCLPLQTRKTSSTKRAKQLILGVIIFSVIFNLPRYFHFYPIATVDIEESNENEADWPVTTTQQMEAFNDSIMYINNGINNDINNEIANIENGIILHNLNTTDKQQTTFVSDNGVLHNIPSTTLESITISTQQQQIEPQRGQRDVLLFQNKWYHFVYHITLMWLVQYVIPIISLLVLNIILLRQIRHAQRKRAQLRNKQVINMQTENISVTINIIAIVTVFIICQTPDFGYTLISYSPLGVNKAFLRYMRSVCYCFLALNSSINFLLYCLFFKRFRRTIVRLFCYNNRLLKGHNAYERQVSDQFNGDTSTHSLTANTRVDTKL